MCPSQNEQNRQEHNEDAANNILIREIESWSNFEYALREENSVCIYVIGWIRFYCTAI